MTHWKLTGTYFETCNCDVGCPCAFGSAPTEGFCSAIVAWHIEQGKFGAVTLDGLNVVLLVDATGIMVEDKWKVATYVDERANEAQKNALLTIFSDRPAVIRRCSRHFSGRTWAQRVSPCTTRAPGRTRP